MSIIEKSNSKDGTRLDKRMRVYDVYDGQPDKDDDEIDDVSADYDEEEYEDDDFE